jgi:hypothetical protein
MSLHREVLQGALPIGAGCRPEFHRLEINSDLPHGDFNHQTPDVSINHDNHRDLTIKHGRLNHQQLGFDHGILWE